MAWELILSLMQSAVQPHARPLFNRSAPAVRWFGLDCTPLKVLSLPTRSSAVKSRLAGSFAYTPADFQQAVDILAKGEVHLDGTWLQERPLEACEASFVELIDDHPETAKIVLHP